MLIPSYSPERRRLTSSLSRGTKANSQLYSVVFSNRIKSIKNGEWVGAWMRMKVWTVTCPSKLFARQDYVKTGER